MTQPATPAPATEAAPAPDAARAAALEAAPSAAARADILIAEHHAGKAAEAAKTAGQPAAADPEKPADAPAAPQTPEEHLAARKARLKALTDQDAQIAARRAQRTQDKQLAQQLAQERQRAAELEQHLQRAKNLIDPEALDEAGILGLMAKKGIPPKKLIDWAAERVKNPELAASEAATRALDPKVAKLEATVAEQSRVINEFLKANAAQAAAAQQRQVEEQFCAGVKAEAHPLAARVLQANRAAFLQSAEAAASHIYQRYGSVTPELIMDHLETEFEAHASLLGASAQPTETKPPGAKPNPPKVQPTTISNRAAAERASHKDAEDEWSSLSFEERKRRLLAGERAPVH